MGKAVYVREEVCAGCGLCEVYCQLEHSRSGDLVKAFKRERPTAVPRVRLASAPEICFPVQCRQCEDPLCVQSCLTGAMCRDRETGVVTVHEGKCIGCWTCVVACAYGALARAPTREVVLKCDLCPDREIPACVANCPNEALILGLDGEICKGVGPAA
ncbi:MAG: 4Fe-4S dicluster domain-containing protein [Chloroflexota bacterium]